MLPVHPHGRGDNPAETWSSHPTIGSPPRAWGQFPLLGSVRSVSRFTPTGVGTINAPHGDRTYSAVHPHGRGDNCQIDGYDVFVDGSPPRAWGQSRGLYAEAGLMRFTPTGVGTINVDGLQTGRDAVHPHGRGDNRLAHCLNKTRDGSPPRAWGQLRLSRLCWRSGWFTPTGVGTIGTNTTQ